MAATLLHLPSHADIHEFSVLFTRSVKKKQKDWHDGYLKWHTFNFRAILYDDQRKQVANEFFPRRTIRSDSELEFSSALVQIGEQTEILQANLEQIYRSNARIHDVSPVSAGNPKAAQMPRMVQCPMTPGMAKVVQNRVYPQSCMRTVPITVSRDAPLLAQAPSSNVFQDSPIATPNRRAIGLSHKYKCSTRQLAYPRTNDKDKKKRNEQDANKAGWFARQDQLIECQQSDSLDRTARDGGNNLTGDESIIASKVPKVNNASRQARSKERLLSKDKILPRLDSVQAIHQNVSVATVAPALDHGVAVEEYCTLSRLDPTRIPAKRKARTMLSATKATATSATSTRVLHTPSHAKVSQVILENHFCAQTQRNCASESWMHFASGCNAPDMTNANAQTGVSVEVGEAAVVAQLAADRFQRYPSNRAADYPNYSVEAKHDIEVMSVHTDLDTAVVPHESTLHVTSGPEHSVPVTPTPHLQRDTPIELEEIHNPGERDSIWSQSQFSGGRADSHIETPKSQTNEEDALAPGANTIHFTIAIKKLPVLDDDGFVGFSVQSKHTTRQPTAPKKGIRRGRPIGPLMEQYPVFVARTPEEVLDENLDRSQMKIDIEETIGLISQINESMARSIAKHSTLGRLAPKSCSTLFPKKCQTKLRNISRAKMLADFVAPKKKIYSSNSDFKENADPLAYGHSKNSRQGENEVGTD